MRKIYVYCSSPHNSPKSENNLCKNTSGYINCDIDTYVYIVIESTVIKDEAQQLACL